MEFADLVARMKISKSQTLCFASSTHPFPASYYHSLDDLAYNDPIEARIANGPNLLKTQTRPQGEGVYEM